jgi:hypothetical protein
VDIRRGRVRCAVTFPGVTEVWALPGFDVQALIGFGTGGEVWRARELSTGDAVALKRLRPDTDVAAIDALRREALVLRSLDTPYVVRLRDVLGDGPETVLVLDHADGGSLAALLTRRGSLDPAEVVTVAAPVAQALAAAHASGLVHGAVTAGSILFTAEGMPLLADLGMVRLSGAAAEDVDEAADVWALAALCHAMLCGSPPDGAPLGLLAPTAPRALVAAVERGLDPDPAVRPDAAAFASLLRRAHAAAPVRLGTPPSVPVPSVEDRREVAVLRPQVAQSVLHSSRRRLIAASAASGLLVVAAVAGWVSGRSGPVQLASVEAATVTPSASPAWPAVLDELDRARADAFAAADATKLTSVYATGSPLLAADRRAVAALVAADRRARGVRHAFRRAVVTSADDRTVVLRVVDVLAAYEVVDASGRVVTRTAPRAEAAFVVRLVRTPSGWRLAEVRPA